MPSKYLYAVKTSDEVYVVAAYSKEEAVESAIGKIGIEFIGGKDRGFFKAGNISGTVYVIQDLRRRMVKKTAKNIYIQLRDGYAFYNEDELEQYLRRYSVQADVLKKWIVKVDKFSRKENVKVFEISD